MKNYRMVVLSVLSYLVIFIGLSGCAVGPNYVPPKMAVPDNWLNPGVESENDTTSLAREKDNTADLITWWTMLDDPVLERLIRKAGDDNLELREAYYRIIESRAQKNYALGAYFPRIDARGSYSRSRESANGTLYRTGLSPEDTDYYATSVDASWEIDLFGRIKRSIESADASLGASQEMYNDSMVSLFAEIASTYVTVRTLQERIKYAQENIESQNETLKLTQARFKAELVPELDVEQAKLNLANTESALSSLNKAEIQSLYRLAVLLGTVPSGLEKDLSEYAPIPDISTNIPHLLPVDIIRQRPDIRYAERNLAMQTARIGIAKADLYPKFTLNGSFGFEAVDRGDLLDVSSRAYSFTPRFDWNIFDGNRIRNNVKIEKARTEQYRLEYEQAVLNAIEEVEISLAFLAQEKIHFSTLKRATEASKKSVELVRTLYKSDLTDFQNVLDMQRTLFVAQDNLASSKGQIIQEWIRIYKAFGGGWSPEMRKDNF
ncbi:MAG: efflux transporter outer membrane subunit [bacterium]|nr:efflux transporter outer membrane subunit [bacterium]